MSIPWNIAIAIHNGERFTCLPTTQKQTWPDRNGCALVIAWLSIGIAFTWYLSLEGERVEYKVSVSKEVNGK